MSRCFDDEILHNSRLQKKMLPVLCKLQWTIRYLLSEIQTYLFLKMKRNDLALKSLPNSSSYKFRHWERPSFIALHIYHFINYLFYSLAKIGIFLKTIFSQKLHLLSRIFYSSLVHKLYNIIQLSSLSIKQVWR